MEIVNRKAHHDYFVKSTYEAGIELMGTEIKSIRLGNVNINDSYARIKDNEIISYEDRNQLVRIQTPQAFRFKLIKKLVNESKDLSDDAQFALLQNEKLLFVNGNKKINKITTIEDIDYIIYSVEKEND